MKTVAIIGGGFSGAMAAVNLARLSSDALRIFIVNCKRPLGRGAAYGTARSEHLLNVAARNMSALPDHPNHFVDWLRTRSEFSDVSDVELREMFAPRKIYGDYISSLLASYRHPIDLKSQARIETVVDEAIDLDIEEEGATIVLKSGGELNADAVLLAIGNQPPTSFPCDGPLAHDRRYCADPWGNWFEHLPPPGGRVALLGTGLTAIDVVVTLAALDWEGQIIAISRSGLLPRPHFRGIAYSDFVPEDADALPLAELVKLVQLQCQRLERISQNPAIAIDKLRPHTQRIWRGLSVADKQEFLRKYATRWNSIRHRIPISIHQCITDALDTGRLEIIEGAVESLSAQNESMRVHLRGAEGDARIVDADLVVNCTGPQARLSQTDSPLLRNLLRKGLIRTDELDLGIDVDDDFQAVNAEGEVSDNVYAIGPLLKGTLWETTAVPELRGQAMLIAQSVLHQQHRAPQEFVIEYCI